MTPADLERPLSLIQRAHVLDACHDGPVRRSRIAERAGCSRSTAYRATSQLADRGLLERSNGGYRLTGAGRAMLDHVRRFVAKLDGTERLIPLFEYLDEPAVTDRAHLFTDADVVTQDASSPYRIETRMREVIAGTQERMIGMTTGLGSPALAEAMIERIQAGVEVVWVLPTEMYDQFTDGFGELSAHALGEEQTSVSVRGSIPVDLAIYDDTLVLIGFDGDRGVLGAVAVTDDPDATRWARAAFDDCRRGAEAVE